MSGLEQFRDIYIAECAELLAEMEERLLNLDCEAADLDQLNAIFRCAHSIKGGSGAFGFDFITHFTHALEALLDAMREGRVSPSRPVVDTLLRSVDIVTQMVQAARNDERPPPDLGAQVLKQLQEFAAAAGSNVSASPAAAANPAEATGEGRYHIHFAPEPGIFCTGNEPLLLIRELARLGELQVRADLSRLPPFNALDPTLCYLSWEMELSTTATEKSVREVFEFVEDHCRLTITRSDAAPAASAAQMPEPAAATTTAVSAENGGKPKSEETSKPQQAATSIRVDLEKVDRLVNMIGELVITEAMLKAQARNLHPDQFAGLLRGIDDLTQHTREIQEAVMSVRMQPVKSIFARMPRIVRDLSAQLGKDIRLVTYGENTEVDKTVIEQLGDPLTHMIRNSIDHGIEKPELRVENGKPPQGVIELSAMHQGGRIVIEIRDDGAGVNHGKVLAKAREKGLIAPGASLSEEEIENLIFLPGFSTAEVVSNISGRGVGMDVVRRNIESLEGSVQLRSVPGKGSVFTVSLPLTLAILDGMIVRVGCEFYIIPIISIIETMRPRADETRHVEGRGDVINVRGEFVPLIYLHRLFAVSGAQDDPSRALVVLVEAGKEKMGVVVDELVGQQQVVIKSLEANTDPVPGISGATILGDGRVSLILEINQLRVLSSAQSNSRPIPQAA